MLHLPVGWRMDVRPGDQVELLADGSDLIVVPVEKRARTSK